MKVAVVTLFPELLEAFFQTSLLGRARDEGRISVHLEPLRHHGLGKHRSVDDTPYGGGSGMLMRPDCVVAALEAAERGMGVGRAERRLLLSPQGKRFDQSLARELSHSSSLCLICGRYEGFDERVRPFVDQELSVGDFVLQGGEIAAMCVLETVLRLLPGVLGNQASTEEESFGLALDGLLEYPQYTRPAEFRGLGVPEVLLSGDHARIAAWRRARSRERTAQRRPDLLARDSDSSDPDPDAGASG